MENLLTTEQVAKYLRLNPVTVRRKVARGEIPAVNNADKGVTFTIKLLKEGVRNQ